MVLSAPPAHDPQGAGDAGWLERITRVFRRTEKGVLVLCDHATDARLRDLVRHLCQAGLSPEVLAAPGQLAEVPTGSVVVLAVRPDDATWLNLNRPVFQERALRVVLWSSEETTAVLARRAPDTYDWISHRVECPPGVPRHAVAGFRAALRSRAPGIEWTGEKLDEVFAQALPGRPLRRVSAKTTDLDLNAAIRDAGRAWLVCSEVTGRRPSKRLRRALEEQRRRTRVILDHPAVVSRDLWPVHDRLVSVEAALQQLVVAGVRAPGRMAALAGLEPEAVELLAELSERSGRRAGEARETEELERLLIEADDPGEALGRRWIHVEAERRRTGTENGAAIESGRLRRSSPVWRAAVNMAPPAAPWTGHDEPRPPPSLSSMPASEYPASRWPVGSHGKATDEEDPDEDLFAKSARLDLREHELRYAVLQAQAAEDRPAEAEAQLAFGDYLVGRKRWREAENAYDTALRRSRDIGSRSAEARALLGTGHVLQQRGQVVRAEAAYKEGLSVGRSLGDRAMEGDHWLGLGNLAVKTGASREAEKAYRKALAVFDASGSAPGSAVARAGLGRVLTESGQLKEAEAVFEQALSDFREAGDLPGRPWMLVALGGVYRLTGRFAEAVSSYRAALEACDEQNDELGQATCLLSLGAVLHTLGSPDEAEAHCRRALAIHERHPEDSRSRGQGLLALGRILLDTDRLAEAETVFREGLSILQTADDRPGQAAALLELGRLATAQGDWRSAHARLTTALATHEAVNDPVGIAMAQGHLGELSLAAGHPLRAIAWLAPALRRFDALQSEFSRTTALTHLNVAFDELNRPEAARASALLAREASTAIGPTLAQRLTKETDTPSPDDLAPARDTLAAAIAEAEAEFQASGEDLFAPPPE